jgi:hypothetical protein
MTLEAGKIYLIVSEYPGRYEFLYRIDSIEGSCPYSGMRCHYTAQGYVLATTNPTWAAGHYLIVNKYVEEVESVLKRVKKEVPKEELPLYISWPYLCKDFTKELSGV